MKRLAVAAVFLSSLYGMTYANGCYTGTEASKSESTQSEGDVTASRTSDGNAEELRDKSE